MNEWWLLVGLMCFLLGALSLALYPLRKNGYAPWVLASIFIATASILYWHWGGWFGWQDYLHQVKKQQQVQTMLKSMHGVEELTNKLRARLNMKPESAQGWYLLGRLYASQNQWQQANDSFALAQQLKPADEQIKLNFILSLWQLNHQIFNSQIRELYKEVLKNNKNQPDALAMLAMDAYTNKDYRKAIVYWKILLNQTSLRSPEEQSIRKAIAQAEGRLSKVLRVGN